jgi:hypothetical protein
MDGPFSVELAPEGPGSSDVVRRILDVLFNTNMSDELFTTVRNVIGFSAFTVAVVATMFFRARLDLKNQHRSRFSR